MGGFVQSWNCKEEHVQEHEERDACFAEHAPVVGSSDTRSENSSCEIQEQWKAVARQLYATLSTSEGRRLTDADLNPFFHAEFQLEMKLGPTSRYWDRKQYNFAFLQTNCCT